MPKLSYFPLFRSVFQKGIVIQYIILIISQTPDFCKEIMQFYADFARFFTLTFSARYGIITTLEKTNFLEDYAMKFKSIRFKEIDSTNEEAKRYVSGGGSLPALIFSESQTAGKGRLGRSFFSSDNKGVYATVVFSAPDEDAFLRITSIAAVCAVESIKELFGISTEIKWVNDIYFHSKKAGGILAESFVVDGARYVAVGFGINLYTRLPEELRDIAISLFPEYPDSYTLNMQRDALADRLADKLLSAIESSDFEKYIEKYRALSCVIGNDIVFTENGSEHSAAALDINSDGSLLVRLSDGTERSLSTGEISLRVM